MRTDLEALQARAKALHLSGLLAHWQEADKGGWVPALLDWEEQERARRGSEQIIAMFFSAIFWRKARSMSAASICAMNSRNIKASIRVFFFNQIGATSSVDFKSACRFSILGWYL